MGWKKYAAVTSSMALVGVVVVFNGCSSSSSNSAGSGGPSDAASENVITQHKESGASSSGASSSGAGDDGGEGGSAGFDGTTGMTCTKDADCNAKAGINVCSIDYNFTITAEKVWLWPTPICLPKLPSGGGATAGNCDPCGGGACSANAIYGCDSADLDPTTSPGICLPNDNTAPVANEGLCLPRCTVPTDGSAPTGCPGKDTCVAYTWLLETNGTVTGVGFCQGSCQQDSDCSALGTNVICQQDIGFCTQATAQKVRSKAIGAACTGGSGTTSDSTLGNCNCEYNQTTMNGYCTSSCVVGGTACPDSYVCDAFYPYGPLDFGNDASVSAITSQNTGAVGTCIQPCTLDDAGAVSDAGAACPTNSTCQLETLVGPDCLP